ncbi:MAG: hypothetical protein V2G44_07030 [bacterium JZ-2024 1]
MTFRWKCRLVCLSALFAIPVALMSCGKFSPTVPASKGQPQSPTAITGAPTGVTRTTATLTGTVNPRGAPTTYWFEWGTTTAYGNQTSPQNLPGDYATRNVTASLISLSPNTTYHYRVCAQNAQGRVCGNRYDFDNADTAEPELSEWDRITCWNTKQTSMADDPVLAQDQGESCLLRE